MVSQHRLESFFHELDCNGMTSFMEFMICVTTGELLLPAMAEILAEVHFTAPLIFGNLLHAAGIRK